MSASNFMNLFFVISVFNVFFNKRKNKYIRNNVMVDNVYKSHE